MGFECTGQALSGVAVHRKDAAWAVGIAPAYKNLLQVLAGHRLSPSPEITNATALTVRA